ncbi:MAG: RtcB family protein [Clostridiales bacterium]|nr:RtcB family protein [Clostridiales bacterium]
MNDDLKIFTENIEPEAVNQVYNLIAQPPFFGAQVRIMPDVHCGMNCVVGFTATLGDKIIPNVLGSDLGCGMLTVELGKAEFSLADLDGFIRAKIPCGSNYRKEVNGVALIKQLRCFDELRDFDRLYGSLGTLGGGNHFIEVDADTDGNRYLVIHSGSRNLGLQVAKIYQKRAEPDCKFCAEPEKAETTARLKAQGKQSDIPAALQAISQKYAYKTKIPAEYCYLEGDGMADYMHDLKLCQQFAVQNRKKMADDILKFLKISRYASFETVHNFIDDDRIVRKGAIPARKGQRVIIPMNMRDGCLIAVGKGNPDWNNSAPHGAGRILRRSEAKDYFTVEEFKKEMAGVYTTTVGASTLDESPMVYKPMDEIVRLIAPTVDIEKIIKPIYNFKAGNE